MRIAMILSTPLPPREGIGCYAWNLARYLARQKHEVHLLTRRGRREAAKEEQAGIQIWRPACYPAYPFHVHLHGLFVNALIEKMERQIDLFHLHSPLPPAINTKRPVMVSFHSTLFHDVRETRISDLYTLLMKLQAPISVSLEKGNLKRANLVNAISPGVAAALNTYYHLADEIPVVWNGVDVNFFNPGIQPKAKEKLILYAGRLVPGKGLEDLFKAFLTINQKAGNARLLIAGEGPLRQSLRKAIQAHHLGQKVLLLGHIVERKRLVALYQRAAVCALPSQHEGLPTTVLEAMACGCAVVATRVGGLPELIEDGANGRLVARSSPGELARAIGELLEDGGLQAQLGLRARQTIVERFSWEAIGANFIRQYEGLLGEGNERH